jgi:hypothetical protein
MSDVACAMTAWAAVNVLFLCCRIYWAAKRRSLGSRWEATGDAAPRAGLRPHGKL